MTFELHIWGPAFGLPSIDAECIAAVAFFNQIEPDPWTLVAAHDPSCSPTGDLPALHHDSQWIGGFAAIVEYMEDQGYSMDNLNRGQIADARAIKIHLATNAQPLLDAIYYTSSVNYASSTRSAWSKILPSYANFVVPPRRLAAALSRTASLGLVSGSVDDVPMDDMTAQQQQEARIISSSPSLLFKKRQTLQEVLKTQQSRNLFRLEALIEDVMDPLDELLGDKEYLVRSHGHTPSSCDCLAVGYLSLLFNTHLENSWVAETTRRKYSSIAHYVDRLKAELLPSRASHARNSDETHITAKCEYPLPWALSPPSPPGKVFQALTTSILSSFFAPIQQRLLFGFGLLRNSPSTALRSWTSPSTIVFTFAGPLVAALSYLTYQATHSSLEINKRFSNRQTSRLNDFGNAGELLSILSGR